MPDGPALSVVVPVYNEENKVAETIRRIDAYLSLRGLKYELLVVSDGSRDRTDEVVREFFSHHSGIQGRLLTSSENRGKGHAARRGALTSKGRYVLMTDADLSAPIKEIDKLLKAIEAGADVAIGSRARRSPGADVRQSFKRRVAGRIFNALVGLTVMRGIQDTQCGFKCFTRQAADLLFERQKLDGFAFDVELLYLARKNGLKVAEVPVMWQEGADSRIRLFRDSRLMFKDLFRIRRLHAG